MDNKNKFFETGHLTDDLKGRSIRGGAVTITTHGAMFFLQMSATIVLSRLLTPEDFGLVAMVTAVAGFLRMFKDMGLSMATVQKEKIDHAQVSTLFWINIIISIVIMLILMMLAPVISWFYKEPRLIWITLALAGMFIFGGLTVQHQALLNRQMYFGRLGLIQCLSKFIGIASAIILALYGIGYWSLVFMQITTTISLAIFVWIACGWRPGLPSRKSGIRPMLTFGGYLSGFSFVNYFSRNLDNILIGRYWGSQALGFYSKAYNLLLFPLEQINGPISSVAIPGLSRLQNEPEKYRRYYLKTISIIAFIGMPLSTFIVTMSNDIILFLLGPQWMPAAKILTVLGISAPIQVIYQTQGWLHVSLGRTDRLFRWGIIGSTAIVISFLIGIQSGPLGVAIAYTSVIYIIVGPCLWYAGKPIDLKLSKIVSTIWKYFVAAIFAGFLCSYILSSFDLTSKLFMKICIGFILISSIYLISIIALYQSTQPLRYIISLSQSIIPKKKKL